MASEYNYNFKKMRLNFGEEILAIERMRFEDQLSAVRDINHIIADVGNYHPYDKDTLAKALFKIIKIIIEIENSTWNDFLDDVYGKNRNMGNDYVKEIRRGRMGKRNTEIMYNYICRNYGLDAIKNDAIFQDSALHRKIIGQKVQPFEVIDKDEISKIASTLLMKRRFKRKSS